MYARAFALCLLAAREGAPKSQTEHEQASRNPQCIARNRLNQNVRHVAVPKKRSEIQPAAA
jgi:hypothetical protein